MRLGFSQLSLVVASLSLSFASGACGSKADPASAPEGASAESQPGTEAKPSEAAAKKPRGEKPPEATGVQFVLAIDGVESKLSINAKEIAARGKGSRMAFFSCMGLMGSATISDFTIGDDPAKKGTLFSASVTKTDIGAVRAGRAEAARIDHRRAGEPTQTQVKAMATWNDDMMSGSAEGTGEDGKRVKLTWTCESGE